MNELIQLKSTLIGSKEAVETLKHKSSASLLVVSDSHGDTETLRQIIEFFGPDSDALVFCGDGFRDVITLVNEAFYNTTLRMLLPPVIACARGNCDPSIVNINLSSLEGTKDRYGRYREYIVVPQVCFNAAGRVVLAVHGNRHNVCNTLQTLSCVAYSKYADLVFYGHTHIHRRDEIGGTVFLNPGSCSRPRGGQVASFAVVSFPGDGEHYESELFCIRRNLFGNYEFTPHSLC
ncbi:MAG TPA: YfcE family phosphodiesterase [Treponemataceae bacterium]|nr:YfcE family phosphodiesterase [Treponemataceae bacterium]